MSACARVALALALLGFSLFLGASAYAGAPPTTIAVMPFRDLAAGRPNVGAALRETLTVDMGTAPRVRVVEREAIDRVLREQAVDPSRVLEGVLGARIGTLLGATHLVTGAYQREGAKLRVTARIVVVETGLVVGAAKVDGELDRLLELEDSVSIQLLGSAGIDTAHQHHRPPRPRIAARAIERFGDAVLEPDTEKKKTLLREAVAQSPQFSYASDALAALEGRLAGYEAKASVTFADNERTLLAAAKDEKLGAAARVSKIETLLTGMRNQRRYHALLAACDALASAPPAAAATIAFHRYLALEGLRRVDDALAAGEQLLAQQPGSPHFAETETRVRVPADERRVRIARVADYDKDLKEKRADLGGAPPADASKRIQWDWVPCIASRWNRQYDAHMIDGCRAYLAAQGESAVPEAREHARAARLFVILALGETGRFAEARQQIADFRRRYPEGDEELDKKLAIWPTD